jgi:AcrR family transcriptional regulator
LRQIVPGLAIAGITGHCGEAEPDDYAGGMPRAGKGGRYHHGDLRAALIDTAVDLIGERGVRHFSLAEASRRLGVAVSAPYAHFSDRDDLLAAVAVRGFQQFAAELAPDADSDLPPAARLAAMTAAYIRFAASRQPLFEVLYDAGLDKARHPELAAAQRPVDDAFLAGVTALAGDGGDRAADLAAALEATARGHAAFLLDGSFGQGAGVVEQAAQRAARAALALIEGRHQLSRT